MIRRSTSSADEFSPAEDAQEGKTPATQYLERTQETSKNRDNQAPAAPVPRIERNYNPRDNREALFQLSVNLPPLHACPPENTFKARRLVGDDVLLHLKEKEKKHTEECSFICSFLKPEQKVYKNFGLCLELGSRMRKLSPFPLSVCGAAPPVPQPYRRVLPLLCPSSISVPNWELRWLGCKSEIIRWLGCKSESKDLNEILLAVHTPSYKKTEGLRKLFDPHFLSLNCLQNPKKAQNPQPLNGKNKQTKRSFP